MPRGLLIVLILAAAAPAAAQQPQRLPIAAMDLRGFYSGLGRDPVTAGSFGLPPESLPKRALGGVVGVHFYPMRKKSLALGVGGEAVLSHGRAQEKDEMGLPISDPLQQRLRAVSAVLSLNFGHREGWSYISLGMGPLTLDTYIGEIAPPLPSPARPTLNMGAGARWFSKRHLAFCFDLRFYRTRPQEATALYPPRQGKQLLILSGGIAIK